MVVAMDTHFTLTARKAAQLLSVSLMAQVERSVLKITLDIMASTILHFHALNLQHLPRKSGLEGKDDCPRTCAEHEHVETNVSEKIYFLIPKE